MLLAMDKMEVEMDKMEVEMANGHNILSRYE